jgi:hypothetical protein
MRVKFFEWLEVKVRMKIAVLVDNKNKNYCWAELAMWAMFPEHHYFSDIWQDSFKQIDGCNYCGKCQNKLMEAK